MKVVSGVRGDDMPIYAYRCESCAAELEFLLSVEKRDEPEADHCPYCAGLIKRVQTKCTFRLGQNGNIGWANNGYADNILGNDPTYKRENNIK